jgi:phosphopantothenoylcysteine synthetase/decarboxylase
VPERDLFWDSSDEQDLPRSKTPVIAYWNQISLKLTKNWLPGKNTTMVQKPRFQSNNSSDTEKESNVTKWQKNHLPKKQNSVMAGTDGIHGFGRFYVQ